MGKIFCTECGTELDDSVKFCSNCGTPINKESTSDNSKAETNNDTINNDIKVNETSKKDNATKFSKSSKIFLGIIVLLIILAVIGIIVMGSSTTNNSNNPNVGNNAPKDLSPAFKDTIYGITFKIPEGYKTIGGKDNQNKGTMVTYDRSYSGPGGNMIDISVSTTKGNFYWDLTQNREYNDVEKTINGHAGVLKSSGTFSYVDGDKLVVITGADEQQLKTIIPK